MEMTCLLSALGGLSPGSEPHSTQWIQGQAESRPTLDALENRKTSHV